jgi:PITH domain
LHIPFTGQVKLRSIIIKSGEGESAPDKVKIVSYILIFKPPCIDCVGGPPAKFPAHILLPQAPLIHRAFCVCVKYANELVDFEEATSQPCAQEFDLVQSLREAVEYQVRVSKFSNVKTLSLFFPSNFGAESTRIYFIGFKGEFTEVPSAITFLFPDCFSDYDALIAEERASQRRIRDSGQPRFVSSRCTRGQD